MGEMPIALTPHYVLVQPMLLLVNFLDLSRHNIR